MKLKDLLYDLMVYEDLNADQQKEIRETYNITKEEIYELLSIVTAE